MNKEALIKDLNEVFNLISDNDIAEAMERLEFVISEVKLLNIPNVSGLFEFSKFLNDNFKYFDNIEVGDVYKCKLGTGLYSEKEVYDKYLSSK